MISTVECQRASKASWSLPSQLCGNEQSKIMLARYYSSGLGRFMAVDPAAESINLSNPQSWNRYIYALNNPLRYVDPNGQTVDEAGKPLLEEGKKADYLSDEEKADLETAETDEIDRGTYVAPEAAFAEREPDGETVKKDTIVKYDLNDPDDRAKAEQAKKGAEAGSPMQPLGGLWEPTGGKSGEITIFEGTRKLNAPDSDQTKWQVKMFTHEVGESLGRTHKEMEDRAKPE